MVSTANGGCSFGYFGDRLVYSFMDIAASAGYLYIFGDSSIDAINNVTLIGTPGQLAQRPRSDRSLQGPAQRTRRVCQRGSLGLLQDVKRCAGLFGNLERQHTPSVCQRDLHGATVTSADPNGEGSVVARREAPG